ncbi:Uncharacterised protein [Serratia proteamaculans]|nr:Uncharacterised protein [Serratia proteamaculans]CAI0933338.1 Uncharacterised protein [Serratia proteamaculans]
MAWPHGTTIVNDARGFTSRLADRGCHRQKLWNECERTRHGGHYGQSECWVINWMIFSGICRLIKILRDIPVNIHASAIWLSLLTLPAAYTHANVTVSVTEAPSDPNGPFFAKIVGASASDPTPNPCYGTRYCRLRFFTISESWLPLGRDGYSTQDTGDWNHGHPGDDSEYATIGEWWSTVINKDRVAHDWLPDKYGADPCVVLAMDGTGAWNMRAGTIISNCAKGLVQVPSCRIEPAQIVVTFDTTVGRLPEEQTVPDVRVGCSQSVRLRIETNSAEEIPLGGDNTSVAILDWGRGYGVPGVFNMSGQESRPVPLRVKTRGVERLGPGTYSGSAVVNVTYD